MKPIHSLGMVRAVVDGERATVDAVISTGEVARDDAVIDPAGWDFANYRRNPVVLFNHDDLHNLPVARTIDGPTPAGNELVARAEFDMEDEFAARLFGKIQRGFVFSTSVRWLPKRWEFVAAPSADAPERTVLVFREQELLEWSFVNIPADPGAVIIRSADGGPIDITAFQPPSSRREEEPEEEEPEPGPAPRPDAAVTEALGAFSARLATLVEARTKPLDLDGMIVRALAKTTGRSEERVRQELAEGVYAK